MTKTRTDRLRLASIEITQRCNRNCEYCEQTKSDREMSIAQFDELLDTLTTEGVEAIALGGGEPTLHSALPDLLDMVRRRGLRAGLTTNARDPGMVLSLTNAGLLESFGVSAGKGEWTALVHHPRAIVNLLLLHDGQANVKRWAVEAIRRGARCLLLLGYKGNRSEFVPSTIELSNAFRLLTMLARKTNVPIAADDYTRRRLGLAQTCGEGFVRMQLDGTRDSCCFPTCEYRAG
ncbi:MAG: radical SAM protein [Chloroflexi bacterium]|nr:radical SAM protein [Chloroflexota bacterium]